MKINKKAKKDLLIEYLIAVASTMKAMEQKEAITKENAEIIIACTANLAEIYNLSIEDFERVKTDMDFDISFNNKI